MNNNRVYELPSPSFELWQDIRGGGEYAYFECGRATPARNRPGDVIYALPSTPGRSLTLATVTFIVLPHLLCVVGL